LNYDFYHPIAIESIRGIVLQQAPSLETIKRIQWALKSHSITF
jgi:hypothetical protein